MRVRLIKKKTIDPFAAKHGRSRTSLEMWYNSIKYADWNDPKDILQTFGSADLLGNGCDRVVFNIGGNNFRIICKYWFSKREAHLYVKWIGTHNEYNKLRKLKKQFIINDY